MKVVLKNSKKILDFRMKVLKKIKKKKIELQEYLERMLLQFKV